MPARIFAVFLLLACMIGMPLATQGAGKTVVLTAFPDNPPLVTEAMPGGGFATQVVQTAFQRAGYDTRVVWLPWRRGYVEVTTGQVDASYPWFYRSEREGMAFSRAFAYEHVGIYLRSDRRDLADIRRFEDLVGTTLCYPDGYAVPRELVPLLDKGLITREVADSIDSCGRLLANNRADTIILSQSSLDTRKAREIFKGVEMVRSRVTLKSEGYHLVVSKDNPRAQELIAAFNRSIEEMQLDGSIDRIAARLGVTSDFLKSAPSSAERAQTQGPS